MSKSLDQYSQEKKSHITQETLYRGKIITLRVDTINNHKWAIIEHPGAAAILPVDENENLILVKQWRRAVKTILLEIPAGALEKDEDPLECAQRELQEETGFKANEMISLGMIYSAPGFCSEKLHLYLARDLSESYLPQDDTEAIDVHKISLKDALAMIDRHEIHDAKTVAAIFLYLRWKQKT